MYRVNQILDQHGIKNENISTPKGVRIMADNGDGTFTSFGIGAQAKDIMTYLGY